MVNRTLFFCLFAVNILFAQIPSSPETTKLSTFNTSDVNMSKGLLNLEVKFHEISMDDISVDLGLKYFSGGIKVEEEASNFGTSWDLTGKSYVSRRQNGLPDEFDKTYRSVGRYIDNGSCDLLWIVNNVSYFEKSAISNIIGNYYLSHNGSLAGYSGESYISLYNPEPDVFEYVLPNGRSGNFIITNPYQALTSSNDEISVFFDIAGSISRFIITDVKGNKFYFDQIEKRNNSFWDSIFKGVVDSSSPITPTPTTPTGPFVYGYIPCQEGTHGYNSHVGVFDVANRPTNVVWYISKVVSKNNKEITYSYDDERHSRLTNTIISYDTDAMVGRPYKPFNNSNRGDDFITKRLKRIDEPDGYVLFEYKTTKREDVKNSYNATSTLYNSSNNFSELRAIQSIKVFGKDNTLIKNIAFETSYKTSNGFNSAAPEIKYLYKRLWLNKITINSSEQYSFEYFGGNLPYKFSKEQDFWGNFNANGSDATGKTLLPDLWFYPDDPRSKTRPTKFSIFKRYNFSGTEAKLSNSTRFSAIANYVSNREANENALMIGMLKKITYPTKGYETFSYENNKFIYDGVQQSGYGLRIAKVEKFDNNNSNISTTNYKYEKQNQECSGIVSGLGVFGVSSTIKYSSLSPNYKISTASICDLGSLFYSRVVKENPNNGKIVTEFLIPYTAETITALPKNGVNLYINDPSLSKMRMNCEIGNQCYTLNNGTIIFNNPKNLYDYPKIDLSLNYENLFGNVIKQSYINQSGTLIKEVENFYDISDNSKKQVCFYGKSNEPTINNTTGSGSQFVKTYGLVDYVLTKSRQTDFYAVGSVTSEDNYLYNQKKLVSEESHTNSEGKVVATRYEYCDSSHFTFNEDLTDMRAKKMFNYPIVVSKYTNGDLLYKKYNKYKSLNASAPLVGVTKPVVLSEEFLIETNKPIINFVDFDWSDVSAPTFGVIDSRFKSQKIYHKYDELNGNLLEVSEFGGIHTVFIWGYNKTKIIAKLDNITYNDITPSTILYLEGLSNSDNDNCTLPTCKEQILRVALHNLRVSKPSAMVTTYTYNQAVGVTSITDPKGDTVFYTYDEFNRLKNIKDKNGNIISENQYHLKN